jgi:hypothetical protein
MMHTVYRTRPRYEFALTFAVIAVFAVLWVIGIITSDPPPPPAAYLASAILLALVATPWVAAVLLLWRAWTRNMARVSAPTMDGPARLLAAAATALPDHRRDWGAAMTAELTQVRGGSARWRFATGSARTALFAPCGSRIPVVASGALTAAGVVAAALAAGNALPAMRVFAVTFVALVGAVVTMAVARRHRARTTAPSPTIAVTGTAGVAACIAGTAYFLTNHPTAGEQLSSPAAVILAVALAGALWLALTPPRALIGSRLAAALGVAAALLLGAGFLVISRSSIHTGGGPMIWILLAPAGISFFTSTMAAAIGRSFRTGVQTAAWAALIGTLLIFALWLPESIYRFGIDAGLLLDGDSGPIGENLADAIFFLIAIPLLGFPFGVIGAAVPHYDAPIPAKTTGPAWPPGHHSKAEIHR